MGISKQLSIGCGTYFEAHQFIKLHGLFKLFLLPVLLNILLFSLMMWLGVTWASSAANALYQWMAIDTTDWNTFNWVKDIIYWTLAIVLNLMVLVVYLATFRYLMLVLIAPIIAYVSEKTEALATGKSYPFSLTQLLKDVWRGMKIAGRNGITELLLTILLLLLGFIPIIGWVTPVLLFMVQSYFYGFSMMDYYFERQRLNANESRKLLYQNKWVAIGNGSFFNGVLYAITILTAALPIVFAFLAKVLFVIPIIFLSILPIYSAVAGTLAAIKINSKTTENGLQTR
jgi:CysZ protein